MYLRVALRLSILWGAFALVLGSCSTDVIGGGACGNDCLAGSVHANWSCVSGACVFDGCEPNYYDLDGDHTCEYPCTFVSASEDCNGNDDNCNGQIDEQAQLPFPTQVCGTNPSAFSPECTTDVRISCESGAWKCVFPTGVCDPSCAAASDICDTLDNDCDGSLNENVPNWGQGCASDDGLPPPGHSACRTVGAFNVCTGPTTVACSAVKGNCAALPGGCTELCDDIDNDCDGLVDEPFTNKGTDAANYVKPVVTKIGGSIWTYSFEASRPSATISSAGTGNGYFCSAFDAADPNCDDATIPVAPAGTQLDKTPSCSVQNKLPWFNVAPREAEQVCKAAGGMLCPTATWQTACQAMASCTWGYNPRGAACTSSVLPTKYCNLGPFDSDMSMAGNQDNLLRTGSSALSNCWADWSGLQGNQSNITQPNYNRILDITGNLREITKTGTNMYTLMGGAFNTADPDAATCSFASFVVDQSFQLTDTGFRCCFTTNPS